MMNKEELAQKYLDDLSVRLENELKHENELNGDLEDVILVSQVIIYPEDNQDVFDSFNNDMYMRLRFQLQMAEKGIHLDIVPKLYDWNGFEIVRVTAYKMGEKHGDRL